MASPAPLVFGLLEGQGRAERVLRWIARKLRMNEDRAAAGVRHVGGRLEDLAADRAAARPRARLGGGQLAARRGGAVGVPARVRRVDRRRRAARRVRSGQRAGGHPDHAGRARHHRGRAAVGARRLRPHAARPRVLGVATWRLAQFFFPIVLGGVLYATLRVGPWSIERRERLQRLRDIAADESSTPSAPSTSRSASAPPAPRRPPRPTTDTTSATAIRARRPTRATVRRHDRHERPFGRCLEDFVVGDVYQHWPGKTITEYDDHLFCMITMNHHPLHTNDWFARAERAGPQRRRRQPRVLARARHERARRQRRGDRQPRGRDAAAQVPHVPRRHDPRRDARARRAAESKSKTDRGIVTVESKGFNQDGKEVCYFRRRVMVWKRDARPAARRPYDGRRAPGS